ncbi:MAG: hypothetical protein WBJ84_11285 [Bacteroidales bacterium]
MKNNSKLQIVIPNKKRSVEQYWTVQIGKDLKFHSGTSNNHGVRRTLPCACTKQGVAMLSVVLKTDIAVKVSIQIMNAFVQMRKLIGQETLQQLRLSNIENRLLEHDQKFDKLFTALEQNELPQKGLFFDGQVFDANVFVINMY